jgi:deoxyribodipyrimidine photolyase-related protein
VEILEDDRFLASRAFFKDWAAGRQSLRMEFFYREMRRAKNILMEDDKPAGGKWNYDSENRKKLPAGINVPGPKRFAPDEMTRDVMALVEKTFPKHYGGLEKFDFPVTAKDAKAGFAGMARRH